MSDRMRSPPEGESSCWSKSKSRGRRAADRMRSENAGPVKRGRPSPASTGRRNCTGRCRPCLGTDRIRCDYTARRDGDRDAGSHTVMARRSTLPPKHRGSTTERHSGSCRLVRAACNGNATDVLLWGRRRPPALNCRLVPVRHRPSAAAQVFKSHALAARGAVVTQSAEEGFYSMT